MKKKYVGPGIVVNSIVESSFSFLLGMWSVFYILTGIYLFWSFAERARVEKIPNSPLAIFYKDPLYPRKNIPFRSYTWVSTTQQDGKVVNSSIDWHNSMYFFSDNIVQGYSSCQGWGGRYELKEEGTEESSFGSVSFHELGLITNEYCKDSQIETFLEQLKMVEKYEFKKENFGENLYLKGPGGTLEFRVIQRVD